MDAAGSMLVQSAFAAHELGEPEMAQRCVDEALDRAAAAALGIARQLGDPRALAVAVEALAAAHADEDAWVLLFDCAGAGPLDQWFGDIGHLEMWIREPELAERHCDQTWVLLR